MSRIKRSSLLVTVALALCGAMTSCKDDDLASDEHYQAPDWLKGNAYEVMQKDGNHTIFLRAIDLSDYQEIVAGKSILTVVAPSDEAFRKFLTDKGYNSIDDLDKQDHAYLNKLVGYHLMYYAFDWNKMVNFRPTDGDGATDAQLAVYAGYYYKHRTHAQDPIEERQAMMGGDQPQTIKVYHNELYLPVLSNKLFETKGIDASYNYNYFFPDSKWGGSGVNGYFNIANASVEGEAVVTDNGYLYNVDQVVEPLNTIYEEMAKNPNYSKFLAIYNNYSTYETASDEVNTSLGYVAYMHSHGELPPIAWEWPSKHWNAISTLEMAGYNLFAPTNNAIDNFFRKFWTQESGYTSADDLDPVILRYFVYQSFANSSMPVFPEEIKKGDVLNGLNSYIDIDPDQVTDRKFCANGLLYGMDNMEIPSVFSSVVGPAFKSTDFRWYLYALERAGAVMNLATTGQDVSFVTLMPRNAQLAAYDPEIRLSAVGNGTYELQQYNDQDAIFQAISAGVCTNIASMHVAQNVKELKTSGTQVVPTNAAYNYWFIRDGQITTNALFNKQLTNPEYTEDPFVDFHPILNDGHNWSNGASYSYDAPMVFEQANDVNLGRELSICNDPRNGYYLFAQLLNKAGLVVTKESKLDPTVAPDGNRFILFCPTNEALTQAIADNAFPGANKFKVTNGVISGTVSGATKTNLANYLRQYFVSSMTNVFSDYPFVGSSCKGEFLTMAYGDKLSINDDGSKLTISLGANAPVPVVAKFSYLPFAFPDGCLHFLDGIL